MLNERRQIQPSFFFPGTVRSLLLLFTLAAGSGRLAAAETAEPWEAGPLAADPAAVLQAASQAEAGDGDHGVVVLFSETRVRFEEDGRETRVEHMVYRIVNAQAAEDWSAIETQWSPWHQERPELRARVISAEGAVHTLDPATITEAGVAQEPSLFEDGRLLRAPLPAAGPGAVVEQEVTVRDTAPFFDHGTTETFWIKMMVPVRHARLIVDAPESLPLRHVVRQLPEDGFREETVDGRRRLSYEARDLAPYGDIEPHQPPDVRWLSYVALSTGASWADVARRYAEIVEEAARGAGSAPEIQKFLRAAKVPAATRSETIERLLARLGKEVRYTGVELGAGKIVPRPPGETLRRKFGDCKDKAVLLVTLLRALDIPAEVALLAAGESRRELEESLPGMGAFNHAIVVLPATPDSPETWIDPTDRYARAGELGAGVSGRLALIASPSSTSLVRIPEATAADNRTVETREFFLSDLGPALRVVETTETWGETERILRTYYASQDEKSLRESITGLIKSAYLTDQLGTVEHSDPVDLATPFHIRLEAKEAKRGYTDLQSAVVAIHPASALADLPDELSDTETGNDGKTKARQTDYFLARPLQHEVRYRAVPPDGFRAQQPPPGRVRNLGPATLSEEYAVADDGALTATLRFEIGKRRLTAAEVEALRTKVHELSEESVVFLRFEQVGEALLTAGHVPEALAELRRLAARSPQKPLPHIHLARALLAGGMGEAAREEARRAVELDPSSVPAYQNLAWILQHDEIGRQFGPGFDLAGALTAYRKAKELDPKDTEARSNLAITLEYDKEGRRYAPGADLPAAIAEYRALRTDLDDRTLDDNLLFALLWAERFAEMKELLADLGESETHSALRLVAVAATEGVEAALREAERRLSDGEKRRTALLQASQYLVQVRRYAEGSALLAGAARQAPNAAELLARVEFLRKVKRHEEISLSPDDPAALAQRIFLAALDPSPDVVQEIRTLYSRDVLQELGSDEKIRARFDAEFLDLRQGMESKGVPREVARDITLAGFETAVTGDEAVGYRISLTTPFNNGRMAIFAVREDGEYRLAGLSDSVDLLGREALRRLRRNDLRGARQWLDWARELVHNGGGDDPLAFSPFAVLWTQGAEATAGEVRCAAASLISGSDAADQAVPLLLSCRDAAPEGQGRTALDLSLARAYRSLDRPADLADTAGRLAAAFPRSEVGYVLLATAFTRLSHWDDLRRYAEARLAILPDDPTASLSLYESAEAQGDLDGAERWLRRIIDSGKASDLVYNNLAWLALVRGKVDDAAIENGQRAATLSQYKEAYSLHTLAALYAEQGKTAEAYQLILQVLELKDGKRPESVDWYVFGRLAEHYGLPAVARRYYARVEAPEPGETDTISTFQLARKRLAALGPEAKPARRSR
ncbi:MAG TPA: DUF3857 domain-containing protein [Thermoanaerobaculia bacterium]|nr:DUF3857 domain-containing protein [Thermoanaerobaculia bacterium]